MMPAIGGAAKGALGMAGMVAGIAGAIVAALSPFNATAKAILKVLESILTVVLLPLNALLRPVLTFLMLLLRILMPNMKKAMDMLTIAMKAGASGEIGVAAEAATMALAYLLKPFLDLMVMSIDMALKTINTIIFGSLASILELVLGKGNAISEGIRSVMNATNALIDKGALAVIKTTSDFLDKGYNAVKKNAENTGLIIANTAPIIANQFTTMAGEMAISATQFPGIANAFKGMVAAMWEAVTSSGRGGSMGNVNITPDLLNQGQFGNWTRQGSPFLDEWTRKFQEDLARRNSVSTTYVR